MSISSADISAVLERIDILSLIQEHVPLRRVGGRYVGLCPFHSENTPSFSVNPALGVYYCFGCHASGDAISFVRNMEKMDFSDAVEYLAGRAGVTITRQNDADGQKRGRSQRIRELLARAIEFYRNMLEESPEAEPARRYLASRGLDGEIAKKFVIGFSPRDANRLPAYLGAPSGLFVAAGLGYADSSGRVRDMFAGRVVFPIFDASGHPVALGGRIIPGVSYGGDTAPPKYKNSPETEYYAKRRTLYGLNWAKNEIVKADSAIICEGYTDVIGFFGAGLPIAVATCGTALTEEHLDRLKNFSKNVVLAFDGDAAGANATERIYQWERKFGLSVKVASFPDGEDPASLGQKDPATLRNCVQNAEPFLAFRIRRHFATADFGSIEGRWNAAAGALALVAEHPNPLVRGEYVMVVADRCHLEARELERRLDGLVKRHRERTFHETANAQEPRRPSSDVEPTQRAIPNSPPEDDNVPDQVSVGELLAPSQRPYNEALKLLAGRPNEMVPYAPSYLFVHPVHLELLRCFAKCATAEEVIGRAGELSPVARSLLMRLVVEPSITDEVDVIGRLVELHAERTLEELMRTVRHPDENEPPSPESMRAWSETITYLRSWQARLRENDTRDEAVGVLLAFFSGDRATQ